MSGSSQHDDASTTGDPRSDELEEERAYRAVVSRMFGQAELLRIDRFTVLERVGEGATGSVFAVYDPRLDRKVALKLLRKSIDRDADERLLGEARMLARVSHPNIVPLFEVGVHEGRVFLAMEFVRGQTLRAWARQERRPWREVVAVYVQAGAALAAAHAAGIVHRDFKPDNALLGEDGRVRVVDFGLARVGANATPVASEPGSPTSSDTTKSGIGGTPAYMSPEQARGAAVDGRTDQFAFAVSLYEALYGTNPFGGETLPRRIDRIAKADLVPPPRDSAVPQFLHEVVLRGLRADPAERFPSMDALLDALQSDPSVRRRRLLNLGGAAAMLGIGTAGVVALASHEGVAEELCGGAEAQLEGVWDEQRRAAVSSAMSATGLPYAADTLARTEAVLDDYALAWRTAYADACTTTRVRGEASTEAMDLKMGCLARHRRDLAAVVDVLAHADAGTVEHAARTLGELPPIDACADLEWLRDRTTIPEDPELRPEVDRIRDELARARALRGAGAFVDARTVADEVLRDAEATGFEPLVADAALTLGQIQIAQNEAKQAAVAFERAFLRGTASRHDDVAATAAAELFRTLGVELDDRERAWPWAAVAEAAVERLDDRGGRGLATLAAYRGSVLHADGKYADAVPHHRRALELARIELGEDHPTVATYAMNLSQSLVASGDVAAALQAATEGLALSERALGNAHPHTARSLGALAIVQVKAGDRTAAVTSFERALEIMTATLGEGHGMVGQTHMNLAIALDGLDRDTEAEHHFRRAIEILERARGPEDATVASAISQLGGLLVDRGEPAEARPLLERALAIGREALGPEHPRVAMMGARLAEALDAQGRHDEAIERYADALGILEKALGRDHTDVADLLVNLGGASRNGGRHDEALQTLERALAIYGEHPRAAWAAVPLAELSIERGDASRARTLLERTLGTCETSDLPTTLCDRGRAALARLPSP